MKEKELASERLQLCIEQSILTTAQLLFGKKANEPVDVKEALIVKRLFEANGLLQLLNSTLAEVKALEDRLNGKGPQPPETPEEK